MMSRPIHSLPTAFLLFTAILLFGSVLQSIAFAQSRPDPALTPTPTDTLQAGAVRESNGMAVSRDTGEPVTAVIVDAYPNGAKRMLRSVVDGRAEGLWLEWYESGVPRYMATWRDGKGHGPWVYFHENGHIREHVHVENDVYVGPAEGWHANGQKAFAGYYRDGQRHGTWRRWNERGRIVSTESFDRGTRTSSEASGSR